MYIGTDGHPFQADFERETMQNLSLAKHWLEKFIGKDNTEFVTVSRDELKAARASVVRAIDEIRAEYGQIEPISAE